MKANWYTRLLEAIEADGRSYKQLSAAIGHGQNYIQQMIKDAKEPGADKLAKLLDELGEDAALYVMTGVRIEEDDLALLENLKSLPKDAQRNAVAFFEALLDPSKTTAPAPFAGGSSVSKE